MDTVFLPGMGGEIVDPNITHKIITTNMLIFLDYAINGGNKDDIHWYG